jgi:geranylgeranyl diphosphate synthase type I
LALELDRLERLAALLPGVPALDALLAEAVAGPLQPVTILPLAAAAAAGGDPADAIHVAAAWFVLRYAMRVLDDLADHDRPHALHELVGAGRATNLAAGLLVHSHGLLDDPSRSDATHRRVIRVFNEEAVRIGAGQDVDLCAGEATLPTSWRAVAGKSGRAFALACAAGAAAGGGSETAIEACRKFGHHLGVVVQLFDDLEGIWEGLDLERGKVTLPVLFAASIEHSGRTRLKAILAAGELGERADVVRELLDTAGIRTAIVCAALEERESALAALAPCRAHGNIALLAAYVTAIFADAAEIAGVET